ncbi:MAG: isopropylmalate isomerase [Planctomycetaceae bacterium]|nr:isopropylmalate isomerase [Planctomycetaceae bacterium]
MSEVKQITGAGVPLFLDDIDTDRIIPARFLRCVSFDGLGEHAFEDDRKQDTNHPFDDERFANGKVLVSGRNFGCGSSREHAPQSLMRWGIQAVIAESFAEIFFGNCTGLGIPAVCADREELKKLAAAIEAQPDLEVTVDLEALQVRYGDTAISCTTTEEARSALVSGQWDFLGQLLAEQPAIRSTAASLPYLSNFA